MPAERRPGGDERQEDQEPEDQQPRERKAAPRIGVRLVRDEERDSRESQHLQQDENEVARGDSRAPATDDAA